MKVSSRLSVLPSITRNETEINNLREATMQIHHNKSNEPKVVPKILLLSMRKNEFKGLSMPIKDDEELERRENAKKLHD